MPTPRQFVSAVLDIALVMAIMGATPLAATDSSVPQYRCGWFENPTPSNAWLVDRDGEWTIGIQGGHQAAGDWPEFTTAQWVSKNGNYGFGCACLLLVVDPDSRQVLRILRATARPLGACRRDPALREPAD
jgi:hypothetical protein